MTENNSDNNSKLKEEIRKSIKAMEKKFLSLLDSKEMNTNKEIGNIYDQLSDTIEKNKIIVQDYSVQKIDHQKMSELQVFKNKVESMLITHEIRINNNIQDLLKSQSKYDKIIIDNLLIPGYIGPSCQYRNLGEYLSHNIYEMGKLKSENEKLKRESSSVKSKIDAIMRQMLILNETTYDRCTEYVENKRKDIEKMLEGKLAQFNDKLRDMRLIISQFQLKIEEQTENMKSDINKALNIKKELSILIEEKNDQLQKMINLVHKKAILNIQDIGICKRKINEVITQVNENNEINEINDYLSELETKIKKLEYLYNKHFSLYGKNSFLNKREMSKTVQTVHKSNIFKDNNSSKSKDTEDKEKEKEKDSKTDKNPINSMPNYRNREKKIITINIDGLHDDESDTERENINHKYTISNYFTINNKMKEKLKEREKEKDDNEDNIIKSEIVSKLKYNMNKIQQKEEYKNTKKENSNKVESYDKFLTESNIMSMISDPYILDQKILSEEDIKLQKERQNLKKEIVKNHVRKNLVNLRVISGNNALDLYNYSTSVPRFPLQKRNKTNTIKTKLKARKKINKIDETINSLKSQNFNNYNLFDDKSNSNNFKLVNLELEENASINPDTNNGAYVIAHKQSENNRISKLSITPTSYVNVYNITNGRKMSRLINMTFAKEDLKGYRKSVSKPLYKEKDENKFNFKSETPKNAKFHKEIDLGLKYP